MARYRRTSTWEVEASIDRTWDALLLVGDWPAWWRGFRSVERLGSGDEHGVGMRLRQQWRAQIRALSPMSRISTDNMPAAP